VSGARAGSEPTSVTPVTRRWGPAGVLTGLVGYGAYAVLWSVMWVPVHTGGGGALALYPLFLLAWLPIEALVMVSVVLSVIDLAVERSMLAITIGMLFVSGAFLVASLPTLWYGEFPWYVFLPG
jgi:hypothetical protein